MDEDLLAGQDVQKNFRNLLNDLRQGINGYKEVRWFYASNLGSDRNAQTTLKQIARESNKIYPNVAFRILDFDELAALHKET